MNTLMFYGRKGLHLTESFEGDVLTAYPDPGSGGRPWTIGYGHTGGVQPGDVITQEQAEALLLADVAGAAAAVNHLVHVDLSQNEFDALVDFTFNAGAGNLAASTMLKKLNAGDKAGAADEFERWDMAAGKHLAGLLRRRLAEKSLFKEA